MLLKVFSTDFLCFLSQQVLSMVVGKNRPDSMATSDRSETETRIFLRYSKKPLIRNPVLEISLFCFLYKGAISRNSLKRFQN